MRALVQRLLRAVQPPPVRLPDPRTSPATKAALRTLQAQWKQEAKHGQLCLRDCGLRVFSQYEEDGLILAVFSAIGTTTKTFVDIGAADGINSNCANLAANFGWHGLMVDGNADAIAHGTAYYAALRDTELYPPRLVAAMVTRDNVNGLIRDAGLAGAIDFLSIDMDGNDYWVLEAILTAPNGIRPRVVMVEANLAFGVEPLTIPYDAGFVHDHGAYEFYGAGAAALVGLLQQFDYRLVGANEQGFNLLLVQNGIGEQALPAITLAETQRHPRVRDFRLPAEIRERLVRVDHAAAS